jgi:hypothetical protein
LGEVLREGTSGQIRKSWLTTTGLVLLAFAQYTVLAPIYWVQLFRNISRLKRANPPGPSPPA